VEESPPSPPSTPPPPPRPKNTRRHPRFDMFASVELHAAEETLVLPARNISLGGVYLSSDGHDLAILELGDPHLSQSLGFEQPHVLFIQDMPFAQ